MSNNWIRVSCATLCRIEHQGRFLLLLNANRRAKGLYVLAPIGGAITAYDWSALALMGALPEEPLTHDLRFQMPLDHLQDFQAWFYRGDERERSPYRELREELVQETDLLPVLSLDDVTCRYLWTVEEEQFTARQGQTGLLTHYFLEIFEVKFTTARTLGPLLALPPGSGAAWVSQDVIANCNTVTLSVDGETRTVQVHASVLLRSPAARTDAPAPD